MWFKLRKSCPSGRQVARHEKLKKVERKTKKPSKPPAWSFFVSCSFKKAFPRRTHKDDTFMSKSRTKKPSSALPMYLGRSLPCVPPSSRPLFVHRRLTTPFVRPSVPAAAKRPASTEHSFSNFEIEPRLKVARLEPKLSYDAFNPIYDEVYAGRPISLLTEEENVYDEIPIDNIPNVSSQRRFGGLPVNRLRTARSQPQEPRACTVFQPASSLDLMQVSRITAYSDSPVNLSWEEESDEDSFSCIYALHGDELVNEEEYIYDKVASDDEEGDAGVADGLQDWYTIDGLPIPSSIPWETAALGGASAVFPPFVAADSLKWVYRESYIV